MNEAFVFTKIGGWNFGFTHDLVRGKTTGEKYLERWYFCFLGRTIRLHKFYRGDDDRALHDHPWPFVTFPLVSYLERVAEDKVNFVQALRFHYRPASYKHMVLRSSRPMTKPFFTIVFAGKKQRSWGFWPKGKFVHWSEF